jgi:SIR2-like domain
VFAQLATRASALPATDWGEIELLAAQLADHALLPLVGAGASVDCGERTARKLASDLLRKIKSGEIELVRPPADLDDATVRDDLGKIADTVGLEHPPEIALEALGFGDRGVWPTPADVLRDFNRRTHECVYRVLARMAKERLLAEGATFNYDCHFEGGLLKEGFFVSTRGTRHSRWPELFTVVADAETHASVVRRGEFVLNKLHGCAETWRRTFPTKGRTATEAIVIRWSQLLDWREDQWARDFFRDRCRRHVMLLLGFSGLDPVIHSTLQAVLREVGGAAGPSRLRAIDVEPEKLTLKMLLEAGRTSVDDVLAIRVQLDLAVRLAATLLLLHALLVRNRLAALTAGADLYLPPGRSEFLIRIAVSGPAMLRWTWAVLAAVEGAHGLAGLRERRDDYYIPLTAEPERTLRAFQLRDEAAARLGVASDATAYTDDGSFLISARTGKAFMPLGLYGHEALALKSGRPPDVRTLRDALKGPAELDRFILAKDEDDKLYAVSIDTGTELYL